MVKIYLQGAIIPSVTAKKYSMILRVADRGNVKRRDGKCPNINLKNLLTEGHWI